MSLFKSFNKILILLVFMSLYCAFSAFSGCVDDGSEEEGSSYSPLVEICGDGIDNDLDGLPDDDDDDCHEIGDQCTNGIDDDGDGFADDLDPDDCP